jgi:hypothetical protein
MEPFDHRNGVSHHKTGVSGASLYAHCSRRWLAKNASRLDRNGANYHKNGVNRVIQSAHCQQFLEIPEKVEMESSKNRISAIPVITEMLK